MPLRVASERNIAMICLGLYPNAFRMPISLVLSMTDTNMVLVMPTAATNRDTAPMLPRNTVICDVIDSTLYTMEPAFITRTFVP